MSRILYTGVIAMVWAGSVLAQGVLEIPEDAQVQLLIKGLSYNSKLKGANLLILSRSDNNSNRAKASTEFSGKSIKSNSCQVFDGAYTGRDNFLAVVEALGANLVYLCDDLTPAQCKEISTICASKGILTMSGVPALVQAGDVSMSVMADAGKPKIILSMNRVKTEGQAFSPQFLKLCKIVE